jgi:hypothetical protein
MTEREKEKKAIMRIGAPDRPGPALLIAADSAFFSSPPLGAERTNA